MNKIRTAVVTAAAVGMTIASLSSATAAAPVAPKFLSASQLPASISPWHADPVKQGLPDSGSPCTAGIAPKASTAYRDFRTELDTSARQTTTVAPSTAKAKALASRLRASIEGCLNRLKDTHPGLEGEAFYHGRINVEEGAHVYSIDTADPDVGSTDIGLYSVGRDGRTVTVIEWGQLGDLDGAPLKGFKKTTGVAVAKLY
ncbi:hypothetical protein HRW14_07190 [Streptomyces lunaelactis]|uniref:hypothetical protein n=1 Tax=Streptomyces lunaelactis TaxID=1535768 RepID=UPI001584E0F0|nr:hypothetical protein [Streptomyces lunaelactis]NUK06363.1 hypothetical protein [Streptomyces lunaelactis]NUK20607.1 hypothetical protein [Streptomyces lunaelactis]NUK50083.1 hypothetical protein [Streptomyces lunaelactis]NUK64293.1 hypothetical protein [Streptomyces lunaelactis]